MSNLSFTITYNSIPYHKFSGSRIATDPVASFIKQTESNDEGQSLVSNLSCTISYNSIPYHKFSGSGIITDSGVTFQLL